MRISYAYKVCFSDMKHVTIYKKVGETPLQALSRVREKYTLPENTPLAYAGRLDPMAEGKLLVLIGDTCKEQSTYHNLDKEYVFEILFGFSSDTGDILGIPTEEKNPTLITAEALHSCTSKKPHSFTAPYPVFSSKTVRGKPLFLWALEDRLAEITIPEITTTLYRLQHLDSSTKTPGETLDYIRTRIDLLLHVTEDSKKLGADFRREEILSLWDTLLSERAIPSQIARFSVICSSGTYIRSLAPHLAKILGTQGLAFSICRTNIGTYLPLPLLGGVWRTKY